MNLNPRQRRLLEVVRQKVTMSVEELAQQLDVTPQTVRRDVKQMEEARLLARYHGGVGLPSSVENIDYSQRQVFNSDAKRSIATAVAADGYLAGRLGPDFQPGADYACLTGSVQMRIACSCCIGSPASGATWTRGAP